MHLVILKRLKLYNGSKWVPFILTNLKQVQVGQTFPFSFASAFFKFIFIFFSYHVMLIQELGGNATLIFYGTEEGNEGKTAYMERRPPNFSKFPRRP